MLPICSFRFSNFEDGLDDIKLTCPDPDYAITLDSICWTRLLRFIAVLSRYFGLMWVWGVKEGAALSKLVKMSWFNIGCFYLSISFCRDKLWIEIIIIVRSKIINQWPSKLMRKRTKNKLYSPHCYYFVASYVSIIQSDWVYSQYLIAIGMDSYLISPFTEMTHLSFANSFMVSNDFKENLKEDSTSLSAEIKG